MPAFPLLSLDEFCHLIANELQLDPATVRPEARFVEDLLVDSIRMVDLLMRLEELQITFPMELMWDVKTVDDAYRAYVQGATAGGQAPARARAS